MWRCCGAVWHLPDHFAEEGWGVEALISAPIVFAIEFVSLFFARALFVWFYNVTAFSVLLVAIFHASFDGAINQLSYDVVPGVEHGEVLDPQRRDHAPDCDGHHCHQAG
jgi:hypothetical protein